jgi:hypothetical protein
MSQCMPCHPPVHKHHGLVSLAQRIGNLRCSPEYCASISWQASCKPQLTHNHTRRPCPERPVLCRLLNTRSPVRGPTFW